MKDLPEIYKWSKPFDILNTLATNVLNDEYGIKYVTTVPAEQMLLFKVNGRYVLPKKNDLVKYYGNGEWAIKREKNYEKKETD